MEVPKNKGGRPTGSVSKHTLQAQEMRRQLIERVSAEWQPIIDAVIKNAKRGDVQTLKELFDRVWGKASQPLELEGTIKVEQITGMQIIKDDAINGTPVQIEK